MRWRAGAARLYAQCAADYCGRRGPTHWEDAIFALQDVVQRRELLNNLVLRELRGKYKGTALGWLWSLINPLAATVIFTIVFGTILRVTPSEGAGGLRNYTLFLLCALLPWNFFSGVVNGGLQSLLGNANLIKKTAFPRQLLVLSSSLSLFVTFAIEMGVLMVALAVFGADPLLWILPAVVVMVLLTAFATGLALMLSVANVYFRDSAHFVAIALQVLFYATPIIYPASLVSHLSPDSLAGRLHVADLYFANPMVHFTEAFRNLLYEHQLPDLTTVVVVVGSAAVSLVAGWWIFTRFSRRLAEEL